MPSLRWARSPTPSSRGRGSPRSGGGEGTSTDTALRTLPHPLPLWERVAAQWRGEGAPPIPHPLPNLFSKSLIVSLIVVGLP